MRLLVGLVAVAAASASTISGTVFLRDGQARAPAAGVAVTARSEDGAEIQTFHTDSAGRYRLAGLPPKRLVLDVLRPGFIGRAVAGEDVNAADFEVLPGGVVTGRITDRLGEPLEGVQLTLFRATRSAVPFGEPSGTAKTDDRGLYRAFGLEPGGYLLLARPAARLWVDSLAAVYYPGATDRAHATEIQVAAGSETTNIDLVLEPEAAFRITGRIVGLAPEERRRTYGQATRAGSVPQDTMSFAMVIDADGNFTVKGLPPGTYVITAGVRPETSAGAARVARQKVELQGDLANASLLPEAPGAILGRVSFDGRKAHTPPAEIRVRLADAAGGSTRDIIARAPDYRFAFSELPAGSYTFELASPPTVYLRRVVRAAAGSSSLPEVAVTGGVSVSVDLEAGLDFGRVSGMIKNSSGSGPLPHSRVALARPAGPQMEFLTVQADQKGRFEFAEVRPGEYLVCAWDAVDVAMLSSAATWERVGGAGRRIVVGPGAELDVELATAGDPGSGQPHAPGGGRP